jgi:hypothetical protein
MLKTRSKQLNKIISVVNNTKKFMFKNIRVMNSLNIVENCLKKSQKLLTIINIDFSTYQQKL